MPFKSQAQRRFMYAKHSKIAKRWSDEYGTSSDLPEKVSDELTKRMTRKGKKK